MSQNPGTLGTLKKKTGLLIWDKYGGNLVVFSKAIETYWTLQAILMDLEFFSPQGARVRKQKNGPPMSMESSSTFQPNCQWLITFRRKLRSQTSDNMYKWKAEQGRGREKRKIRRKKSRRERVRRKKMQMREKVGKSRFTLFFQWFGAPEGRKVGSLKRRVRSQLARGEMKNCTPLWREAHLQVKMYKPPGARSTFESWDVEKVRAVVVRSTFPSQNVQNTRGADHFWQLRCRKSARRCGAKHISKSKYTKHYIHVRATFGGSDVVLRGRRKGLCTLSKVSKTWGFCSISRNDGRRGAFEEDLQRCISRGRCSTKDMFIRDVRRSGRSFPERGCILEY